MPTLFTVTFEPKGNAVVASPGTNLLEAARRGGYMLEARCSGQGECGECCVVVLDGQASPLTKEEQAYFSTGELKDGYRLACCMRVISPVRVVIVGSLRRPGDGGQGEHQRTEQQVEL